MCEVMRVGEHTLLLVAADVMGKGLAAAFFADALRTLIRAVIQQGADPADCLAEVNQLLFEQLSGADMFITAQLVEVDLRERRLRISNAGHCPLLLADGFHSVAPMAPYGMPLGIQHDAGFELESVILEPFSSVLLYTDGVTESRNSAGRLFGQARLERWFCRAAVRYRQAAQLKQGLLRELAGFQQNQAPADDQSFLVLADESPRPGALLGLEGLGWLTPWRRVPSRPARQEELYPAS